MYVFANGVSDLTTLPDFNGLIDAARYHIRKIPMEIYCEKKNNVRLAINYCSAVKKVGTHRLMCRNADERRVSSCIACCEYPKRE